MNVLDLGKIMQLIPVLSLCATLDCGAPVPRRGPVLGTLIEPTNGWRGVIGILPQLGPYIVAIEFIIRIHSNSALFRCDFSPHR